jgi:hypothetical protein
MTQERLEDVLLKSGQALVAELRPLILDLYSIFLDDVCKSLGEEKPARFKAIIAVLNGKHSIYAKLRGLNIDDRDTVLAITPELDKQLLQYKIVDAFVSGYSTQHVELSAEFSDRRVRPKMPEFSVPKESILDPASIVDDLRNLIGIARTYSPIFQCFQKVTKLEYYAVVKEILIYVHNDYTPAPIVRPLKEELNEEHGI